mmetsp:Transcript_64565/g.120198  ORF Transcript_64565/g.120198 Transcript_64565/m.120198 type:complete len:801 (-) Transcript_64565:103-2505(-)
MDTAASLSQISLEYSYDELQIATRNFDASYRLGDGTFGGVYRGIQKDGTEVAVKVLELNEDAGFEEEVKVLSKFRHPNLVILMGFARHEHNSFLVYELLSGGDVYKRLQKSHAEGMPFPWLHRINVAFDAACGLSHLHNSTPKVFHRDIKSPNILLDRNGTAKMADFGLSCLSLSSAHKVKQASGTIGYCCPLYVQRGVVTEGSEVYSFGIVLLELLTARQPAYMAPGPDGQQQYQFLVSYLQGDLRATVALADGLAQWPQNMAYAVAKLALQCINMTEELRPVFTGIVQGLRSLRDAQDCRDPACMAVSPTSAAGGVAAAAALLPQAARMCPPQVVPMQQLVMPVGVTPVGVAVAQAASLANQQQQQQQQLQLQLQQQQQQQLIQPQLQVAAPQQQVVAASLAQSPVMLQPAGHLGAQPARAAQQQPVLWNLELIQAEGRSMVELMPDQRMLVHCADASGQLRNHRVGSLFNGDYWRAVLPEEVAACLEREHFQIWAEECPLVQAEAGKTACYFFLTNFSKQGTVVNGQLLSGTGKEVELHEGDVIGMTRQVERRANLPSGAIRVFVELRFDLTRSLLCDADAGSRAAVVEQEAPSASMPLQSLHRDSAPYKSIVASATHKVIPGLGTSFCGSDVRPIFTLEVRGPALREDADPEVCRIVHGYPAIAENQGEAVLVPPLILGRSIQPEYWQQLLSQEAFNALSRQHLQLDVGPVSGSQNEAPVPGVYVTNFSEANPVSLYPADGLPKGSEGMWSSMGSDVLAVEERRLLRHRTVIELNRSKDNNLWLLFLDARLALAQP